MAIAAVILGGLFRAHPAVPLDHHLGPATETVGLLLILRAFASGCSALTGVEAIANAVPEFRQPRARRAQVTEVWLGILLGVMLVGLGALIHKFSVVPQPGITVLAQLTQASLGHNIAFYAVQLITLVLLALAANTSFTDPEDEAADEEFRRRWEEWHPNVPLVTLRTAHRSITQPIVKYLARIEAEERYHQLVVLIPEVQPPRFWDYLLFNQRGAILERAIRRGTANVVLCRLHYRLEHFTPGPGLPADSAEPASKDRRADRGGRADGRDHGQARVLEGGGEDLVGNPEEPPER